MAKYLNGSQIKEAIQRGDIRISPYQEGQVSQCSIDLHLSRRILIAKPGCELDLLEDNKDQFIPHEIPPEGFVIEPGAFVLGCTIEVISSKHLLQVLGKSSVARNGLTVESAGLVEPGFHGRITLELFSQVPLRIHEGCPIAQAIVSKIRGRGLEDYKIRGSYTNATRPGPQTSKSFNHTLRHRGLDK